MEQGTMRVTSIEVTAMQLDPGTGICRGHVVFHETAEASVHFDCRVQTQARCDADIRAALTDDAKRQLLRMPEYRTGGRQLVFLPGAEPLVQR